MSMIWGFRAYAGWRDERGVNMIDGGSHFYDTYACADGRYLAIGAIEPQFHATLRERLGLAADDAFDRRWDAAAWPVLKARLAALFAERPRDAWMALLEGTDACIAPVLSMGEAPQHPHNRARGSFLSIAGVLQPAPAPRFSATPGAVPGPLRAASPGARRAS